MVDHLPIITPALLDVAELDENFAARIQVRVIDASTGPDGRSVAFSLENGQSSLPTSSQLRPDIEQLDALPRLERSWIVGGPQVVADLFGHTLQESLGALVRISDSIGDVERSDKRQLGRSIMAVTRSGAQVATNLKRTDTLDNPHFCIRTSEERRDHIAKHMASYQVLKPFYCPPDVRSLIK